MRKYKKREPVNKPVRFIEYLETINALPANIDEFLDELSYLNDKWSYFKKKEKRENIDPESLVENSYTYFKQARDLFTEQFAKLPKKIKDWAFTDPNTQNWQTGAKRLNMLAVERESLELIISQWKKEKELRKDFEEQTGETSEEAFEKFQWANRYSDKYKQKVSNFFMPLPSVNFRLLYHRILTGIERTGFTGFLTRLSEKDGVLVAESEGLINVVFEQQRNGEPPIKLDRLKYCGFCNNFIYAYKENQNFCSKKCYIANYQRENRGGSLMNLKKRLKVEKERLHNLRNRLDGGNGLIAEQELRVSELQAQITAEENKNAAL